MSDVYIFQTLEGAEMEVANGVITMNDGVLTAIYYRLFGGNIDDKLLDDDPNTWWGNRIEENPEYHFRSQTQILLESLPAVSGNLSRIQTAIETDLAPLVTYGIINPPAVSVGIPRLNHVSIIIDVETIVVQFDIPWER